MRLLASDATLQVVMVCRAWMGRAGGCRRDFLASHGQLRSLVSTTARAGEGMLMRLMSIWLCLAFVGCGTLPDYAASRPEFALQDIQGLWGGRDVYVYPNDTCLIRVVGEGNWLGRGLREHRYRGTLPAGTVESLRKTPKDCHFASYREVRRNGVPDEARPRILWRREGLPVFSADKWDNHKSPRFDPLESALRGCVEVAKFTRTLYNGAYDADWTYPGFEAGR